MSTGGESSSSGRLWLGLAAAAGAAACVGVYYTSLRAYDWVVPVKYKYRPGTISGWIADRLFKYSKARRKVRPIRVYMDGCFDLMHYGHANALRQARALGDELVVGVVGDAEILRCKGPPVLDEGERTCLVEAIKWVDQIIPNVPYDLSPHFIQELFSKHRIDYIVHGDDPCLLPDGSDAYAHAKKLGRFLMIKRTEGVSTTDIVGRMLTCTRSNRWMQAAGEAGQDGSEGSHPLSRAFSESVDDQDHGIMPVPAGSSPSGDSPRSSSASGAAAGERPSGSTPNNQRTTLSRFLPTSRRLVQFSNGRQAPEGARIVYIDGAWDVFHPGHVRILAAARQQGDFLLVGIHGDGEVMARRGPHLPILNVHERALSVLACKWVDEVVIGAPSVITPDLIKTFNISLVLRGSVSETSCRDRGVSPERYAVPAQRGIFRQMASPSGITAAAVITRIVAKREQFEAKQARKEKSEAAYYTDSKSYVSEL